MHKNELLQFRMELLKKAEEAFSLNLHVCGEQIFDAAEMVRRMLLTGGDDAE